MLTIDQLPAQTAPSYSDLLAARDVDAATPSQYTKKITINQLATMSNPGTVNTNWFGGGETSIASAYAALPSYGGVIALGSNITITSAQVITILAGKGLILDLCGFTITLSHPTGIGLYFSCGYGVRDAHLQVRNGSIIRGGAAANVIGVKVLYALCAKFSNLTIRGFSTAGSTGMLWDFVENSSMDCVEFNDNATGLELTNATNQNLFSNVWFQENSRALFIHGLSATVGVLVGGGSDGNTFIACLFQSNTGVHTVDIVADAVVSSGPHSNKFDSCWFENNGNGTASTREFYLFAGATFSCIATTFDKVTFNTGTVTGGEAVEWAGSGFLGYDTFRDCAFSAADAEPVFPVNTTIIDGTKIVANGITFRTPAVAPSSSKVLWDYDQGAALGASFTPAYATSNNDQSVTYTSRGGTYTKIGNIVFFQLSISFNVVTSTGTGTIKITGLPFANGTDNNFGRYTVQFHNVNYDATKGPIYGYPPTNGVTYLQLLQQVDNAAWEVKTVSDTVVQNGSIIVVNGFYFV